MYGLGLAPLNVVSSVAQGLLSDVLVVADSQITPTVRYDPSAPAQPASPGLVGWFTSAFVKPRVRLLSKSSGQVLGEYAPGGPPTTNLLPALGVAAAIGVGVVGTLVWRGITRSSWAARQQNPRRRRRRR